MQYFLFQIRICILSNKYIPSLVGPLRFLYRLHSSSSCRATSSFLRRKQSLEHETRVAEVDVDDVAAY